MVSDIPSRDGKIADLFYSVGELYIQRVERQRGEKGKSYDRTTSYDSTENLVFFILNVFFCMVVTEI